MKQYFVLIKIDSNLDRKCYLYDTESEIGSTLIDALEAIKASSTEYIIDGSISFDPNKQYYIEADEISGGC